MLGLKSLIYRPMRGERDREVSQLIGALDVLGHQRRVAIAGGLPAGHLAELDDEEAGYRSRIEQLGGMVSQ